MTTTCLRHIKKGQYFTIVKNGLIKDFHIYKCDTPGEGPYYTIVQVFPRLEIHGTQPNYQVEVVEFYGPPKNLFEASKAGTDILHSEKPF